MKQSVMETVKTLVVALAVAVGLHSFLFQPFWIPSGSMVPSLLVGDYLFVNKFAFMAIRAILCRSHRRCLRAGSRPMPPGAAMWWCSVPPNDPGEIFVKRLVGLPGDTLQVTGGQLYINGQLAPRVEQGTYVDDSGGGPVVAEKFAETLPGGKVHAILKLTDQGFANNTPLYTVPPGDYFLMGDSRDNSLDSRFLDGPVGYVPAENLLGPAVFILASADFHAPWWAVWDWPAEMRWGRFFHPVH